MNENTYMILRYAKAWMLLLFQRSTSKAFVAFLLLILKILIERMQAQFAKVRIVSITMQAASNVFTISSLHVLVTDDGCLGKLQCILQYVSFDSQYLHVLVTDHRKTVPKLVLTSSTHLPTTYF